MSADNGIYILETKDGFRVTHAQAIDNLWWWWTDERLYDNEWVKGEQERTKENPYQGKGETRTELNPRELRNYFGKCEVFRSDIQALIHARYLEREIMNSDCPILEYGIHFIHGWEDKDFPF